MERARRCRQKWALNLGESVGTGVRRGVPRKAGGVQLCMGIEKLCGIGKVRHRGPPLQIGQATNIWRNSCFARRAGAGLARRGGQGRARWREGIDRGSGSSIHPLKRRRPFARAKPRPAIGRKEMPSPFSARARWLRRPSVGGRGSLLASKQRAATKYRGQALDG